MEGNSRVIFSSRARLDSLLSCDLYGVFSECLSIQHGHGLLALAGGNFNSFWPCAVFSSYSVYNSLDCWFFFWNYFCLISSSFIHVHANQYSAKVSMELLCRFLELFFSIAFSSSFIHHANSNYLDFTELWCLSSQLQRTQLCLVFTSLCHGTKIVSRGNLRVVQSACFQFSFSQKLVFYCLCAKA